MTYAEIAKKLGKLLNGQDIWFDHSSYDDDDLIPSICVEGERLKVTNAWISPDGLFGRLICSNGKIHVLDFRKSNTEKVCERYGMDELFHDIYYETDDSLDIGDYEQDFLGLY